jgi:hypothetical protein
MQRTQTIDELAKSVLAKMYEDVQSSERVISRTEMPEFKLSEMRENIAKFGELRVKKFIEYQEKVHTLRESACTLCNTKFKSMPAIVSTRCVAITLCGAGECHETCNRVIFDLIARGVKETISMVMVEGSMNKFHQHPYEHVFILIGEFNVTLKTVSDLSKLDEKVVLIDGLLNVVGRAEDYKQLIGAYLDVRKLESVRACQSFNPAKVDHKLIYKNALAMANEIKKDIQHNKYRSHVTVESVKLFANLADKQSPFYQVTAKIEKSFDGHEKQADIVSALNTDMDLAFRKVCAFGSAAAILLMIDNHDLLMNFNMDTPSKTSPKTAIDWVAWNKELSTQEKVTISVNVLPITSS